MFGRRWRGCWVRCGVVVLGAGMVFASADAQEIPKPDDKPQPAPLAPSNQTPAPLQDQTPPATAGNGAQVRTGSVVGQALADRLMMLFADHQFAQMDEMLAAGDTPADNLGKLTPGQKKVFRGLVANRENKPIESIQLLTSELDAVTASGNVPEEKMVRKALAEDYLRAGDLAHANQAYQTYAQRMGANLSEDEKDEIELPVKLLPLAVQNPPMTVDPG